MLHQHFVSRSRIAVRPLPGQTVAALFRSQKHRSRLSASPRRRRNGGQVVDARIARCSPCFSPLSSAATSSAEASGVLLDDVRQRPVEVLHRPRPSRSGRIPGPGRGRYQPEACPRARSAGRAARCAIQPVIDPGDDTSVPSSLRIGGCLQEDTGKNLRLTTIHCLPEKFAMLSGSVPRRAVPR
jgi:hypothetical protein